MKKGRPTVPSPWSDLPKDLLEAISDRLQNRTDVTRFRSVCKSWRLSVPPFQNPFHFPLHLPYLGPLHQPEGFLSLKQTTLYYLNKPSSSSSSSSTPASCGWLIKLRESHDHDHHDCDLYQHYHLINPLSPIQVHPLPHTFPRTLNPSHFRVLELAKAYSLQFSNLTFCDYKVAFLPNPDCPSLLIIAHGVLWSLKLFSQHDKWRVIDDMLSQLSYDDVILYGGRFFAVDDCGRIVLVDPTSLQVIEIVPQMKTSGGQKKSLVKSRGELLLVDKYQPQKRWDSPCLNKVEFRVYKLEIKYKRLVEVKSLGDHILFLGQDCSFSLPARFFGGGCKGNCIIFADLVYKVYNLDDGKLSPIEKYPEYINLFYPTPS